MIFKTIEDETKRGGRSFNKNFDTIRKDFKVLSGKYDGKMSFSDKFNDSLNDNVGYIEAYVKAIRDDGIPSVEAWSRHMSSASKEARDYANATNLAEINTKEFESQQRVAEIATLAQGKSLINIREILNRYNSGVDDLGVSMDEFIGGVTQSNSSLGRYFASLNGGQATLRGYIGYLISAEAETIALEAGTAALNAVLSFGLSMAIQGLITLFINLTRYEERLVEKSEEARNAIQSINDECAKASSSVKEVSERFAILAQRVDQLGALSQNKGVLGTEEYEEFLDLSNQLASVFPELIQGYDDNGNAILNLSGSVDTIVASLDDLIDRQRQLANQEIIDKLPDVYAGYTIGVKNAQSAVKSAEKDLRLLDDIRSGLLQDGQASVKINVVGGVKEGNVVDTKNHIKSLLKELDLATRWVNESDGLYLQIDGDVNDAFAAKLDDVRKNYQHAKSDLEGELSSISSYINTWLQEEWDYNRVTNTGLQSALQQMLMSFDPSSISKYVDIGDWEDVSEYLRSNVLSVVANLGEDDEISKAISKLFSGDNLSLEELDSIDQKIRERFGEKNPVYLLIKPKIDELGDFSLPAGADPNKYLGALTDSTGKSLNSVAEQYRKSFSDIASESINLQNQLRALGDIDWYADHISDARREYENELKEFEEKASELDITDHIFGNIDLNKRAVIKWSDGMQRLFADAIESWGYEDLDGYYSTVLGDADTFNWAGTKFDIAFSPLLQTESGAELLTSDTVYGYLDSVINEAAKKADSLDFDEILKIDAAGLDVNGKHIQKLIADIGSTAKQTAETMHYLGTDGSIADAFNRLAESEKKNSALAIEGKLTNLETRRDAIKHSLGEMINEVVEGNDRLRSGMTELGVTENDLLEYYVDELTGINEKMEFSLDLSAETESLASFTTALAESESIAGLNADTITALAARYADLDEFDESEVFVKTASGIVANRDALEELEGQYESLIKSKLDDKLNVLVLKYAELTDEINETSDAQERAGLYSERSSLLNRIEDTKTLISQYDSLTSSYNKWVNATKAADPSDDFSGIGSAYKDIKELIDQGWTTHNGISEYIDLMLAADKQTNDNAKDFEALTQKIEGTDFSLMDLFKYDEDNKLVTDGLYDFLAAIKSLMGESYVWQDEQGKWFYDFSGDKLQEVADRFGTTAEFIQIIEKALASSGMDVTFEDIFGVYDKVIEKSETAITKLHELSEAGKIKSDVDFNLNADTIEEVNAQIEKAETLIKELSGEDGTIDINAEGVPETISVLSVLMNQKEDLEGSVVMNVDLDEDDLESDIGEAISLLQQFKTEYAKLETQKALGLDTSEAEAELDVMLEKMSGNKTITGSLEINTDSYDAAIASINEVTPDLLVKAGLDSSVVDEYEPSEKTITIKKDSSQVDRYLRQLSIHVTEHTIRMKYVNAGDGVGVASGTAHARGTAMRSGNWGTTDDGIALGGELGQEMVVRDGHFFTIGDDSAELFKYKKGDIIFNADQTAQIFKYGKIHSGKNRGSALAFGTAFDTGSGGARRKNYGTGATSISKSVNTVSSSEAKNSSKKETSDEESEFEKLYKYHQHLLEMEQEDEEAYLKWLDAAYKDAYKKQEIELDDYYKYEEEVYDKRKELFDDYLSDTEHRIKMIEHYSGTEAEQIKLYQRMVSSIEAQIADARARGLDDNDDYLQQLQDQYWEYHDAIIDIQDDLADNAKDAIEELIDYRIDMLKDERDAQKDALKDQLDDLKDFYDKQKEMLQDEYDEEEYIKEQSEKRKSVADIQAELDQLAFDNSAWAQKRKNELKKELADAEEELADFEKKHALDLAMDELDAQYEKQEAAINAEIDAIDEVLNDPEALYNQALKDIKKFSAATYLEMLEFNRKNGSGNDDDIKAMVENAYIATGLVGQSYKGAKIGNYTGYTPDNTGSWDKNKISDKGSASTKSTSTKKTTTTTSKSSAKSYPYGKASDTTGILMNGSSGTGVKAIQYALNKLGYGNSGTSSVDGIFGSKTETAVKNFQKAMKINADGKVGPDTRAKFKAKGYAHGTLNATPGIHEVDELGAEYVFESKDGNKYRMFSGGEKVLDAKSTGFLYDFAKNGGKVLSELIKSAFATGLSAISPAPTLVEITVGDTIIQGNADRKTVSEIRREQRNSVDFMLREFAKLKA